MRRALTIGASDSSAASGVQTDLRVFASCGVYGVCAVALVAAQDTLAVRRVYKLPSSIVGAQIDAVMRDIGANACKIGWYRSHELTTVIAGRMRRRDIAQVVLDPCLWSESGAVLTPPRTVKRMVRELFPCADVLCVTPRELGVLASTPLDTEEDLRGAVDRILSLGPRSIVVEDPRVRRAALVCSAEGIRPAADWVAGPQPMAGEGGIFSAALTAGLAAGAGLPEAVRHAAAFVESSRAHLQALGRGLPVWGMTEDGGA